MSKEDKTIFMDLGTYTKGVSLTFLSLDLVVSGDVDLVGKEAIVTVDVEHLWTMLDESLIYQKTRRIRGLPVLTNFSASLLTFSFRARSRASARS